MPNIRWEDIDRLKHKTLYASNDAIRIKNLSKNPDIQKMANDLYISLTEEFAEIQDIIDRIPDEIKKIPIVKNERRKI